MKPTEISQILKDQIKNAHDVLSQIKSERRDRSRVYTENQVDDILTLTLKGIREVNDSQNDSIDALKKRMDSLENKNEMAPNPSTNKGETR
jgi:hypothetical protein